MVAIAVSQNLRQCTACRDWKSISDFGTNRNRKDGISPRCKKCNNEAIERSKKLKEIVASNGFKDGYESRQSILKEVRRAIDICGDLAHFCERTGLSERTVAIALKNPMGITVNSIVHIHMAVSRFLSEYHEDDTPRLKFCWYCRTEKPLNIFDRNPNTRDGYNDLCNECEDAHGDELHRKIHEGYEVVVAVSEDPTVAEAPVSIPETPVVSIVETPEETPEETPPPLTNSLANDLLDFVARVDALERKTANSEQQLEQIRAQYEGEIAKLREDLACYQSMEDLYKRREEENQALREENETLKRAFTILTKNAA